MTEDGPGGLLINHWVNIIDVQNTEQASLMKYYMIHVESQPRLSG